MRFLKRIKPPALLQRKMVKNSLLITPSPYLNLLSNYIISFRSDDGSWFQEPLNTAIALYALHAYYTNVTHSIPREILEVSIKYLKNELRTFSQNILSSEDLYPELDQKAIIFGNIFYTLGIIGVIKAEEEIMSAFSKLELEVLKYHHALANVEAISSMLKCYSFSFMKDPPKEFIRFLLNTCLTSKSLRDCFIALDALNILQNRSLKKIEHVWQDEIKHYSQWKDRGYQESMKKIAQLKLKELSNEEEIETLVYALIIANRLNNNLTVKVSGILFKKLDLVWNKIFKGKIDEIKPILFDISLVLMALSLTPLRNSIFISSTQLDHVLKAINWYDEKVSKGIIPMTRRRYSILLILLIVLIILTIFPLAYILFRGLIINILVSFIISFVVGIILSPLINELKKPPLEKG